MPYHIIEEIVFEDTDSFMYIYKYFNIYNRDIIQAEWEVSDELLLSFQDQMIPKIIVRVDGTIYDVNDAFCR